MNPSLPVLVTYVSVCIAIVAVLINYLNRRSERVKLTRDLFNQFFGIVESRSTAWFWLGELKHDNPRRSFEQVSTTKDDGRFMHLYKVVAFWSLLHALYVSGQVNRGLARSLFQYEFRLWFARLSPLVERTKELDSSFPDLLKPFDTLYWLVKPSAEPDVDG